MGKKSIPPVSANNLNGLGKETTREFDGYGRFLKETLVNNGAYNRSEYSSNGTRLNTFTTGANGTGEVETESWMDGAGRVLKSKTELPNGWAGSLTEYDVLGRVKRSTAPAEFTVNQTTGEWTAAGDDAQYGWRWTTNEYEWKGRVTKQKSPDGSDKIFGYTGCGCTGVQTTTVQGENIEETDWQGNTVTATPGRRTQKIYTDIHGRTKKTEIYNWNGTGSPYSTTVVQFNGRDQAVSVKRYAGAEGAGTPQETKMTYDGFGRLKTQHRPEQDANKNTTYNYNPDNSISSIVDAREAATNYEYEHRGLLKKIYYSAPTGIQIPATVNFTYDNLGNRTQMPETNATGGLDALSGAIYAYDSMSRLTSETRTINDAATGFNQSFTFDYTYNLAGQLTEIKDQADLTRKVTYTRDEIGRVTAVGGGGFGSNNVTSYASNLQYRAFGVVKNLTYGSGKTLTQTFDNRLRLDEFIVSGGSSTVDNLASKNKYYADGQINSAGSITGSNYSDTFDRLYKYDYAGRILEAKSGIEARDATQTSTNRPYLQTYDYNAFGNLTNRTGKVWDITADPMTATYTNNRRYGGAYDADGRNTNNSSISSSYDASGRRYQTEGDNGLTIKQTFDGDGERVKQVEQQYGSSAVVTRYDVRSSVLGTIYEIRFQANGTWYKEVGMVYLNGQQLAMQNANTSVWWMYENPVTGATRGTSTQMAGEPDALGVNNGLTHHLEIPMAMIMHHR